MKWKFQRSLAGRLTLLSIAISFTAIPIHAQTGGIFIEAGAFTGSLLKPSDVRTTGFGVGVGRGKNFIGIDVNREFLGSYEMGVGTALDPNSSITSEFSTASPLSTNAISGSSVESLNGSIRRDLYSFHGRVTAYGLAGAGYVKAHSTEAYLDSTYMNSQTFQKYCNCDPSTYMPVAFGVLRSAHTVGMALGAGVRIPMTKAFGIRAEFKARLTPSTSSTILSPGVVIRYPNGSPISVPISGGGATFAVGYAQGSGAPLKAESFLGITFGVYYRFFNHHL